MLGVYGLEMQTLALQHGPAYCHAAMDYGLKYSLSDGVNRHTLFQGGFSRFKYWLCLSVSHAQYHLMSFMIYWTR